MRIGLDIMGGDFAPHAPLEGIKLAYKTLPAGVVLTLFGDQNIINKYLKENDIPKDNIEVVHTTEVIEMGESPTKAITQKPNSSILTGLKLLKEGHIDIFMSAGNTGAIFVGALYTVKAIEGIMRPALNSIIPKEDGSFGVILDVGANADCKPEVLYQFGILGSVYAQSVFGIPNPKVGLLNIGSEPEKGNLVTQAAYTLFAQSDRLNFIGNLEGYDLFDEKADVVVCDGFTGNIILKTAETIYQIMKRKGLADDYFRKYDYEFYGGTPILGVNKPVIIAHGVSTPVAFSNMIRLAMQILDSRLIDKIKEAFQS